MSSSGLTCAIVSLGWAISGTYFILDTDGAFGSWEQPSGIRSDGVPYNTNQFGSGRLGTFGQHSMPHPYQLDFEMEYEPPIEHTQQEFLNECYEAKKEIDNTDTRKIIIKQNDFKFD